MNRLPIIIALLCLLLTSCEVGPDYVRPSANVPTKYKEAKGKQVIDPIALAKSAKSTHWKVATPKDEYSRGEWWKIFHDAKLNQLEDQLNADNQTILNAFHNWEQARALVDEARANLYPTLTGTFSVTRQKQSSGSTSFISSSSGTTTTGAAATGNPISTGQISTTHSWIADASWEPDIWGQVRRTVEASAAAAQASAALYASTRLSAQASLAQDYFELRGLDRMQVLLDKTVKDYRESLNITKNQYKSGTVSQGDIEQALSLLQAAEAQAVNNHIARGQYEHAIAVLIGLPPAEFSLPPRPLTAIPPAIPLEVPSALLERRPDIAQAERLMAQASAEIGVAVAAYYPTLTLSAIATVAAQGLGHLFSVPSLGWAYGPQLSELIYDGGLRAAEVKAANEAYCASIANYRQVVLTAFQNVEDNLVSLQDLNKQAIFEHAAVNSARAALKIVLNEYRSGTVIYTSVLTAEINLFTAEQAAVTVDYERMTSAAGLIKSLGGGWDASSIACAAQPIVRAF